MDPLTIMALVQGGLTIASGLSNYDAEKKKARLSRQREIEKQTLSLKRYTAELQARQKEALLQQAQLRNQIQETEEIAEGQKGDIALAAEKAKGEMRAAQGSSGLAVGVGTFGNVLREIGFAEQAEIADADLTVANRRNQAGTEMLAAEMRAQVPEPHISEIAPLNTTNLAIGTGLSIASGLTNIAMQHVPLGTFGGFGKRRDSKLARKHGIT